MSVTFTPIFLADAFSAAARLVVSSMPLMPCWVNLKDQYAVVIAQGPIDVRDLHAHLLGRCLQCRSTLGRFVNALDALLGELERSIRRRDRPRSNRCP